MAASERREEDGDESLVDDHDEDIFQSMSLMDSVWWRLTNLHMTVTGRMTPGWVFKTGLILFLTSFIYWLRYVEFLVAVAYKEWFLALARENPDRFSVTRCSQNCSLFNFTDALELAKRNEPSLNLSKLRCNIWGMCTDQEEFWPQLQISEEIPKPYLRSDIKVEPKEEQKDGKSGEWWWQKRMKESLGLYSMYAGYVPGLTTVADAQTRFRALSFYNQWCRLKFHILRSHVNPDEKDAVYKDYTAWGKAGTRAGSQQNVFEEHCTGTPTADAGDASAPPKCYKASLLPAEGKGGEEGGPLAELRDHSCDPTDDLHYDPRRCFLPHGPSGEGVLYTYLKYFQPHRVVQRFEEPVKCNRIPCCRPAWTFPWTQWSRILPTHLDRDGDTATAVLPTGDGPGGNGLKTVPCVRDESTPRQEWMYRRRAAEGLQQSIQPELWEGFVEGFKCPVCFWALDLTAQLANKNAKDENGKEPSVVDNCLPEGPLEEVEEGRVRATYFMPELKNVTGLRTAMKEKVSKCPARLYTFLIGQLDLDSAAGHLAYTSGYRKFNGSSEYDASILLCDHSKTKTDLRVVWRIPPSSIKDKDKGRSAFVHPMFRSKWAEWKKADEETQRQSQRLLENLGYPLAPDLTLIQVCTDIKTDAFFTHAFEGTDLTKWIADLAGKDVLAGEKFEANAIRSRLLQGARKLSAEEWRATTRTQGDKPSPPEELMAYIVEPGVKNPTFLRHHSDSSLTNDELMRTKALWISCKEVLKLFSAKSFMPVSDNEFKSWALRFLGGAGDQTASL